MKLKLIYFIPLYGLMVYSTKYYRDYYLSKEYYLKRDYSTKQYSLMESYHVFWLVSIVITVMILCAKLIFNQ